ncbi:bifunctional UDP-N-acetylglucosamine diphosphorylase/glucosamine-1-phosphate N-acetyltransferase GlmU [Rhodococcus aerolatus]
MPDQPQTAPAAVVVLAAGAGTRMRSATPKVLHPLAGRTLLSHALHAAAGSGASRLVTVIGHDRELVGAMLQVLALQLGLPLQAAVQAEQRGTGHAVACALAELPAELTGTVVITCGDTPLLDAATLRDLVATHHGHGAGATVLTTTVADPTGYGRVERSADDGSVLGVVEERDATAAQRGITEVNSGVYAFDLAVLRAALERLDDDNAQGELLLTDTLRHAREAGHPVHAAHVADAWLVAGVNDRVQLAAAGAELNRRVLEGWMRAGVTVTDPASTWVDVETELARDVTLLPGVQLRGTTRVGEGSVVGPDCTLTDTTVGARAQVVRTHAVESRIGDGASVGPYAYLRPGSDLGADGKIGTFVETKNARIGTASKVPHLTYVGDAEIGEHSNIGASSVFVNYDGVSKNRTTIGSHVRTGSDTKFIAPVTVGDGAYTGAGTVLREDVPPGALAVSGGPQRTLEGWVAARRPGTAAARAAEAALARTGSAPTDPSDTPTDTDPSDTDPTEENEAP